jgi:hypothetical protein
VRNVAVQVEWHSPRDDLGAACFELLHAESDALQLAIAWKVSQVKRKQAQEALAAECGYSPPDDCQ